MTPEEMKAQLAAFKAELMPMVANAAKEAVATIVKQMTANAEASALVAKNERVKALVANSGGLISAEKQTELEAMTPEAFAAFESAFAMVANAQRQPNPVGFAGSVPTINNDARQGAWE